MKGYIDRADYPAYSDEFHGHMLSNIDLSLRRIADSLENAKKLDELYIKCSKQGDEIRRLEVNEDLLRGDVEKFKGRAEAAEVKAGNLPTAVDALRRIVQLEGKALGVGTMQNIARNALAAVGEGVA